MTAKLLATCLAAAAIAGGAVGAVTAAVSITPMVSAQVTPVVFGAPLPQDPGAPDTVVDLPTADQLNGVLYGLADPGVPFASKGYLVEGGIGRLEAKTADALIRNAAAKGQLPLSFAIGPITPAGPGIASATVTATGPAMPPTTQTITFVDQGGWKLSRNSASTVLAIFGG